MNATDLHRDLRAELPTTPQAIICDVLREFRAYVARYADGQRGIVGAVVRIGVRRVIALIDDYLAGNCGAVA